MVRGMAKWEKIKLGVLEKNKKRERKKEENYIKKGGKGLKNASSPRPPQTYLSGKKMNLKERVGKK